MSTSTGSGSAEKPRAGRSFVDREDLVAEFQRELTARDPKLHRVLVYFGVGGIGKTSLRRELMRLLREQRT